MPTGKPNRAPAPPEFMGNNCISVGDVVCLKSGGFMMTVEHLTADDESNEETEGLAYVVWAKDDETIWRDQLRSETLDNVTAEEELKLMDPELEDEILQAMSAKTDKTYPN